MQISQITIQPDQAGSKTLETDPSSTGGVAAAGGAFAGLLAALQGGTAGAQPVKGAGGSEAEPKAAQGMSIGLALPPVTAAPEATGTSVAEPVEVADAAQGADQVTPARGDGIARDAGLLPVPATMQAVDFGALAKSVEAALIAPPPGATLPQPVPASEAVAEPVVTTESETPDWPAGTAPEPRQSTARISVAPEMAATQSASNEVSALVRGTSPGSAALDGIATAETAQPEEAIAALPTGASTTDDSEGGSETGSQTSPKSSARYVIAKYGATPAQPSGSPATAAQEADSGVQAAGDGKLLSVAENRVRVEGQVEGQEPPRVAAHPATANADVASKAALDSLRPVAPGAGMSGVTVPGSVAAGRSVERTAETASPSSPERATLETLASTTVKGVRYLLSKGEPTLRIRLVPESLGELRLEVSSSKGEVTVRMASASHAVRELLNTHVQGLRDALSQDGTAAARITITTDTGAGMNPQAGNPDRAWSQQARSWDGGSSTAPHYPSSARVQPIAVARMTAPHGGALNLFA